VPLQGAQYLIYFDTQGVALGWLPAALSAPQPGSTLTPPEIGEAA